MNFFQQFDQMTSAFMFNMHYVLLMIGILWIIQIVNWLLGLRLNVLGIYPRHWFGLIGIIFSPFLHGNFTHLFFNSFPLFVLISFVLLDGWATFYCVTLIVILLGGLLVWLVGRRAIHIGASGLVMGYWSYLLFTAHERPTWQTVFLVGVCLYYFGGFLLDLFPTQEKTSWEGHLCGFIAGIAAAYLCPFIHL